ncbi:MAG TPA: hypothetical protein VF208_11510, partial [Candidatus Binatia bacterium]
MDVTADEQVHPVEIAQVTMLLGLDVFVDVVAALVFLYRKFKPSCFGPRNIAGPGSCQATLMESRL